MLRILWHNVESAGYVDLIEQSWFSEEGVLTKITHRVLGPRSGQHSARCDVCVTGSRADFDYTKYENFNSSKGMYVGVMRVIFESKARTQVARVLWRDKLQKRFVECSTTAYIDDADSFARLVRKASELSSSARRKRLAKARRIPRRMQRVTIAFERNPDVVAEVQYRAKGACERCGQPAPFLRGDTGTPYLEVHHLVRLADGGEDTVENALALCPNCHRRAHFGNPASSDRSLN